MLEQIVPRTAPGSVITQGRHRHAQIARGEHSHLATKAAGRSTIVGHCHHRRQVGGEVPQSQQRSSKAMAATKRRNPHRLDAQWVKNNHCVVTLP